MILNAVTINPLQKIGDGWVTDLSQLRKLEQFKNDKNLLVALQKVKQVDVFFFYTAPFLGAETLKTNLVVTNHCLHLVNLFN